MARRPHSPRDKKEAQEETLKMLQVYKTFLEEYCAIPVITGLKPEHEKFPGALTTYTLEAMMQDKKFLNSEWLLITFSFTQNAALFFSNQKGYSKGFNFWTWL